MASDTGPAILSAVLVRFASVTGVLLLIFLLVVWLVDAASTQYKVKEDPPTYDASASSAGSTPLRHPALLHFLDYGDLTPVGSDTDLDALPADTLFLAKRVRATKLPSPEYGDGSPFRRLFYQNLNNSSLFYQNLNNSSQYLRRDSFSQ